MNRTPTELKLKSGQRINKRDSLPLIETPDQYVRVETPDQYARDQRRICLIPSVHVLHLRYVNNLPSLVYGLLR